MIIAFLGFGIQLLRLMEIFIKNFMNVEGFGFCISLGWLLAILNAEFGEC